MEFGYEEVSVEVQIPAANDVLRIALKPGPLALDGFTVVADRLAAVNRDLEDRRLSTGEAVRLLEQDRLVRSGAEDVTAFLRVEGGIRLQSCEPTGRARLFQQSQPGDNVVECIFWRGIVIRPDVYIDDVRRNDSVHAFDKLPLSEFYLIEILSSGKQIRAYTNYYIERLAETPQVLPRICIVC